MENKIQFPPGFGWPNIISIGSSGVVLELNAVIKVPLKEREAHFLDIERKVYERLANGHDNVLRYYGPLYNGICLERARHGSLRQHFTRRGTRSEALQLRWIQQVVEAVVFIHSHCILHGDLSCNNVFLNDKLNAKLGDFAGSSIDGVDSLVAYETRSDHPAMATTSAESEVFALGSVMYEILTGFPPYKDLSENEVEKAYNREEYPDLQSLPMLQDVITRCWSRSYSSTEALLKDVKAQVAESDERRVSSPINVFHLLKPSIANSYLSVLVLILPIASLSYRWFLGHGR